MLKDMEVNVKESHIRGEGWRLCRAKNVCLIVETELYTALRHIRNDPRDCCL